MTRSFAPLALLMAVLAGCTGTSEPALPVLLAVGFGDETGEHVALVEDRFPETPRELDLLEDTRRSLAGRAVALDVAERSGERHPLFVLTRDAGRNARLERFATRAVRPDAPDAFERLAAPVDLGALLASAFGEEEAFCLDAVQVSRNGRFVVLLDAREACGDAEERHVIVVDLEADGGARVIHPRDLALSEPVLDARPWLDQEAQRLYYVRDDPTPTLVARPLDEDAPPETALGRVILEVPLTALDVPTALAPGGDRLIVADDDAYVRVDPGADGDPLEAVNAASRVRQLFALPETLASIVAYRTASTVYAHRDPDEDDRSSATVSGLVDGAVGPNDFLFVLAPRRIAVLDLLTFAGGEELRVETSAQLPELETPRALSWIRAAPTPAP